MIKKLKKLLNNSYSPYSNVKVSSILVTNNDKEYEGVNVENASYGGTVCAERSAMLSAISSGEKIKTFKEIHVYSNIGRALYPCAICRQTMTEILDADTNVIIHGDKEPIIKTVEELIPDMVVEDSF